MNCWRSWRGGSACVTYECSAATLALAFPFAILVGVATFLESGLWLVKGRAFFTPSLATCSTGPGGRGRSGLVSSPWSWSLPTSLLLLESRLRFAGGAGGDGNEGGDAHSAGCGEVCSGLLHIMISASSCRHSKQKTKDERKKTKYKRQ